MAALRIKFAQRLIVTPQSPGKETFRNSHLTRQLLLGGKNTRNVQSNKLSLKTGFDISVKIGTMGKKNRRA